MLTDVEKSSVDKAKDQVTKFYGSCEIPMELLLDFADSTRELLRIIDHFAQEPEQPEGDLISRKALLAAKWDWCDAEDAIRRAPAVDAVPVVRCKECKRAYNSTAESDVKRGFPLTCRLVQRLKMPDDFCSEGRRKEQDDG